MPAGGQHGQARCKFAEMHLGPLFRKGGMQIWAGDYNFVPAAIDTANPKGRPRDKAAQQAMVQHCSGMVDTFRLRHPHARCFTYLHKTGSARLDRVYATAEHAGYAVHAGAETVGTLDHRLAWCHLVALRPCVQGPGMPRLRAGCLQVKELAGQLRQWVAAAAAAAPAGDLALLAWWPSFKKRLAAKVRLLNREADAGWQAAVLASREANAHADAAMAALEAEPSVAAAVAAVVAQTQAAVAAQRQSARAVVATRCSFIADGERPCPGMSRVLRAKADRTEVPAVRRPDGRLVTDARAMAQEMADYWARVCGVPPHRDGGDRASVVHAVALHGKACSAAEALAAGRPEVSEAEVLAALQRMARGKAPGADGIRVDMWAALRSEAVPLLARLLSAVGRTKQAPVGFDTGVIVSIYKGGGADRSDPANYRPIALLDSDYKVLATVLAARVTPVLQRLIGPEQCAFLPQRGIGSSILFLQVLPAVLRARKQAAVVAFLDFRKAYDTVDRLFLREVLDIVGLGGGFGSWVDTLLADTKAVALVNGWQSRAVPIQAGVRQGCPLSPALYLFVAHALSCWLQQREVWLDVAGVRTRASQYADDTAVPLPDDAAVGRFQWCMHSFGRASGQALNIGKTELLRVGAVNGGRAGPGRKRALALPAPGASQAPRRVAVPCQVLVPVGPARDPPPPGQPHLLSRVVCKAKALGVSFDASGEAAEWGWAARVDSLVAKLRQVVALRLSVFGRAQAVNAYAVSRVLYAAEFQGLPRAALDRIEHALIEVVDRGRMAKPGRRRYTGVPYALLHGSPRVGGFGLLPVAEHVHARHAVWAVRCMVEGCKPPGVLGQWAALTQVLLTDMHRVTRGLSLMRCGLRGDGRLSLAGEALPKGCFLLARLCEGMRALPCPKVVGPRLRTPRHLPAGQWCLVAPIWANPLIVPDGGLWLEEQPQHRWARELPILRVVADVIILSRILQLLVTDPLAHTQAAYVRVRQVLLTGAQGGWPAGVHPLAGLQGAAQAFAALRAALPPGWCQVAESAVSSAWPHPLGVVAAYDGTAHLEDAWRLLWPDAPSACEVDAMLLRQMGWELPGGAAVAVGDLTVKQATILQLRAVSDRRTGLHVAFVREALGLGPQADAAARLPALRLALASAWDLRWESAFKEPLWRLALDGFPCHGGTHHPPYYSFQTQAIVPFSCLCGVVGGSPRMHHFWECPVACTLRQYVGLHLPAGVVLQREHIWLLAPPPGLHAEVWLAVGMAAVHGMDAGRRCMVRLSKPTKTRAALSGVPLRLRAGATALAKFRVALVSFAALPQRLMQPVPLGHPFVGGGADGRLCVTASPLDGGVWAAGIG
jgi:hypothetical protein